MINVGSLVVSTGDASYSNNNGDKSVTFSNFGSGTIDNEGAITVADAGLVAFVAPNIVNNGVITATLGRVAFGAGSKATLDLTGDNLITIAISDQAANGLIHNSGKIKAAGGVVQMTANVAKSAVDSVINMDGVVDVSSVSVQGGKIILAGGPQGTVSVSGKLKAGGTQAAGGGGSVHISGQTITVSGTVDTGADHHAGGNVTLAAQKAITLTGGKITAGGGNITFTNGGIFTGDAGSLQTDGTGTISLEQNSGGSIQDAIDAIENSGHGLDTVTVGRGTYAEDLALDQDNLSLLGANAGISGTGTRVSESRILGSGDGADVSISGNNDTFEGFQVTGNALTSANLITVTGNKATVSDNILSQSGGAGLYASGANGVTIDSNDLSGIGGDGIALTASDGSDIERNTVTGGDGFYSNGGNGAALDGIYVDSDNVIIAHNTISGGDGLFGTGGMGAGKDGIHVVDSNNAIVDANMITGGSANIFGAGGAGAGKDGILVEGGAGAIITNNKLASGGAGAAFSNAGTGATADGIAVTGNAGVQITGNSFTGGSAGGYNFYFANGANAAGGNGIYVSGSDDAAVSDNTFTGGDSAWYFNSGAAATGADAIDISGGGNVSVTDNVMKGGATDGTIRASDGAGTAGIQVYGAADLTVSGNDIRNSGGYGIEIHNSNGTVDSNHVRDSGNQGIVIADSGGFSVDDNIINGAVNEGLYLANLTGISDATGNKIDGTSYAGLTAINVANGTIDGNRIGVNGNIAGNGIYVWVSDGIVIRNNTVENASGDGIVVADSAHAKVKANTLSAIGQDGIYAEGGGHTLIKGNTINGEDNAYFGSAGAGANGIHVVDDKGVKILSNTIDGATGYLSFGGDGADEDGILVSHSDDALVRDNSILGGDNGFVSVGGNGAGANGIEIEGGSGITVAGNTVEGGAYPGIYTILGFVTGYGTEGDGILVHNADNVTIRNNTLHDLYNGNGIAVTGGSNIRITKNGLSDAAYDGIFARNAEGLFVKDNTIDGVIDDGIALDSVSYGAVTDNNVSDVGRDGISEKDGYDFDVTDNSISADRNGILVSGGDELLVAKNTIDGVGANGIRVDNVSGESEDDVADDGHSWAIIIRRNTIDDTGNDGILVSNSSNVLVKGNQIGQGVEEELAINLIGIDDYYGIGNNGIEIAGGDDDTVAGNTVTGVDDNGIYLQAADDVHVNGNLITNSGANGLFAEGEHNGKLYLSGNTFTDNPTGALFESGTINLEHAANIFNGGQVGLLFSPYQTDGGYANMKLAGDTIGGTVFNGQSLYFVELANGAFFNPGMPTHLDGVFATYNGVNPSATNGLLTQGQYNMIEAGIYDYNDDPTLGLFDFGFLNADINTQTLAQNEIYERISGYLVGPHGFKVTVRGLPNTTGEEQQQTSLEDNTISLLANMQPAAGGDGPNGDNPNKDAKNVSQVEPSSGSHQSDKTAGCWNDAINGAASGVATSFAFGDSIESTLASVAHCGS